MKKIKEYYVSIWFGSVGFEGIYEIRLVADDGHSRMVTSPVCRVEFKGQLALDGYTVEIETKNTIYIMKDFPKIDYFNLMHNCPEEFRGKDWCNIEAVTV
jgi:hypothetical protein